MGRHKRNANCRPFSFSLCCKSALSPWAFSLYFFFFVCLSPINARALSLMEILEFFKIFNPGDWEQLIHPPTPTPTYTLPPTWTPTKTPTRTATPTPIDIEVRLIYFIRCDGKLNAVPEDRVVEEGAPVSNVNVGLIPEYYSPAKIRNCTTENSLESL